MKSITMKIEINSFEFHGNYGTEDLPCQCRPCSVQQMKVVWQNSPSGSLKTAFFSKKPNSTDEPGQKLRKERYRD